MDEAHNKLNRELVDAAREENADNVRWLLDRGADVYTPDPAWGTPLPVEVSSPRVLEVFLEHGFKVNARNGNYDLLWQAAYNGNGPMVAFLLRHGADVDAHGAAALQGAKDGMNEAVERAGAPPPPDGASLGWDEASSEAEARKPYEQVIASLRKAGVHGQQDRNGLTIVAIQGCTMLSSRDSPQCHASECPSDGLPECQERIASGR